MPQVSLGDIADFVGGRFAGDRDAIVRGAATLADAGPEDLSFLSNPKYGSQLATSRAAAILVGEGEEGGSLCWIRVQNPYAAFAHVLRRWFSEISIPSGLSPLASISAAATLGSNTAVGPFVTIAAGVTIGDNTTIFQGVSIEKGTVIGDDCLIYPNVTIYAGSRIGSRCVIHSGVVIGSDGYGFATDGGRHHKIPQVGIVRIEDDVEIGANCTIDRAALGETVIGEGTKLDNLVHVAHNVRIGKHCFLVAQVGIAGSAEIGDYCEFGGQSGVTGHVKLGEHVRVGSKAGVMKSWPDGVTLAGHPARPYRDALRSEALIARLPDLVERIEALEKKSSESG